MGALSTTDEAKARKSRQERREAAPAIPPTSWQSGVGSERLTTRALPP